jgi:antitoxin (DNA-binding transcriptional repressor) of toxin-antitoxin stability system
MLEVDDTLSSRGNAMIRLTVTEAQPRLPELLVAASAGEIVEINEDGSTYHLTAVQSRPRPPVTGIPKAGRLKGLLSFPTTLTNQLKNCANIWNEARARHECAPVVSKRRETPQRYDFVLRTVCFSRQKAPPLSPEM